jgi:hypothetical protein
MSAQKFYRRAPSNKVIVMSTLLVSAMRGVVLPSNEVFAWVFYYIMFAMVTWVTLTFLVRTFIFQRDAFHWVYSTVRDWNKPKENVEDVESSDDSRESAIPPRTRTGNASSEARIKKEVRWSTNKEGGEGFREIDDGLTRHYATHGSSAAFVVSVVEDGNRMKVLDQGLEVVGYMIAWERKLKDYTDADWIVYSKMKSTLVEWEKLGLILRVITYPIPPASPSS